MIKLNELKEILSSNDKVDDYKIAYVKKENANSYFTKGIKVETNLLSTREFYEVTVYCYYENNKMGESSFNVTTDTVEEINKKIEDAIVICSLSKNEKWDIVSEQKELPDVNLECPIINCFFNEADNFSSYMNANQTVLRGIFADQVDVRLSAIEFMFSKIKKHFVLSTGVDYEFTKTKGYVEAVITSKNEKEEQEIFVSDDFNVLDKFNVGQFMLRAIDEAKNRLIAKKAESFKGKVCLTKDALAEFFVLSHTISPLFLHLSSRFVYTKMAKFEKDKLAIVGKKDKLTVHKNPLRDQNLSSSPIDSDLVVSTKVPLFEEGVAKNYFGFKKFFDYLEMESSGALGVIEVSPGSISTEELLTSDEDIFVIEKFSWFAPNVVSGDFSSEVRFGHILKSDGSKEYLYGGMFVGNVFSVLEDFFASKEMMEKTGYYGPENLVFYNATISGD